MAYKPITSRDAWEQLISPCTNRTSSVDYSKNERINIKYIQTIVSQIECGVRILLRKYTCITSSGVDFEQVKNGYYDSWVQVNYYFGDTLKNVKINFKLNHKFTDIYLKESVIFCALNSLSEMIYYKVLKEIDEKELMRIKLDNITNQK